jgi:hypothetical protein
VECWITPPSANEAARSGENPCIGSASIVHYVLAADYIDSGPNDLELL